MEVDRNGLEVLDRAECLRLLSRATLGRLGFSTGALPTVLPVSYHLDGDRILVRTRRGGRLDAALCDAVVAFEVDDVEPASHYGWSVAVTGVAAEIRDPTELDDARDEPADRWTASPGDALVAISTEVMTGRRITAASGPTRC
jgi:nitroimidazol reductase NimA-like FMN-containing flavoprotein (pyridoxamine 5'-phosphate oxidase superfamily)